MNCVGMRARRGTRRVRDLSCGAHRVYLEFEVRRGLLPQFPGREARAAGVALGQSVLHQAFCLLCGPALPQQHDPCSSSSWQWRFGSAPVRQDLWFGEVTLAGFTLHPLVLMFGLSGSLMISRIRIPKL